MPFSRRSFLLGSGAALAVGAPAARAAPPVDNTVYWVVTGQSGWGIEWPPEGDIPPPDPRFEIWDDASLKWKTAHIENGHPFVFLSNQGIQQPHNYGAFSLGLAYVRATGRRLRMFIRRNGANRLGNWLFSDTLPYLDNPPPGYLGNYHPDIPHDLQERTADVDLDRPEYLGQVPWFREKGSTHPSRWIGLERNYLRRFYGFDVAYPSVMQQVLESGVDPAWISKVFMWQGEGNDSLFTGQQLISGNDDTTYRRYMDAFTKMVFNTVGFQASPTLVWSGPFHNSSQGSRTAVIETYVSPDPVRNPVRPVSAVNPPKTPWRNWEALGLNPLADCPRLGNLTEREKALQKACNVPVNRDFLHLSWQGLQAMALRQLDVLYGGPDPAPDDVLFPRVPVPDIITLDDLRRRRSAQSQPAPENPAAPAPRQRPTLAPDRIDRNWRRR